MFNMNNGGIGIGIGIGSNFNNFDINTILKNNDIQPRVQTHLKNVYLALSCCMLCCVLGAYCNIKYNIGSSGLWFMVSFGLMYWLHTDLNKNNIKKRICILCSYGFVQGLTIGGLIEYAYYINPNIIYMSFSSTIIIFLTFSGAALVAKRRSYLYLGSILSSTMSILCIMSFFNAFVSRSETIDTLRLVIGTLVFSGFIIFDTQLIIERASNSNTNGSGQYDCIGDAMKLFTDVFGLFIRIVRLLLEKDKRDKRRKTNNR